MPRTVSVETYPEFCERHGGRPAKVGVNRWLLPDGASVMDGGINPTMREPPADPLQSLRLRRQYHAAKLASAESDFNKLKGALLGLLDQYRLPLQFHWSESVTKEYGPPPPGADGRAALRQLQAVVQERRDVLAAIDREINALPEVQEQRRQQAEREELGRQLREEQALVHDEIVGISI
jgi:hypothetical protein